MITNCQKSITIKAQLTKNLQKLEDSKNNLADQLGVPKYNYDNMFQTGEIGKTCSRLKNELQIAENCETNDYLNYFFSKFGNFRCNLCLD